MASWVTHLMIADGILQRFPFLDRRGFCVGSIAPDCNVENADWTAFTPPREVTHWMQGDKKEASDCERFREKMITDRSSQIRSGEEYSFLLGYYAHLLTDAAFQEMTRNADRLRAVWKRIKADCRLAAASYDMEESWDSVKRLIPKRERVHQIHVMEAEYLRDHPDSGYLTEILPLTAFPNYLPDFPEGAIVRKIRVMGYHPRPDRTVGTFHTISRKEYAAYVRDTIELVAARFTENHLLETAQKWMKEEHHEPF